MKSKILPSTLLALGFLVGAGALSAIAGTWTAAPASGPTNGNVDAPINVGVLEQIKTGPLRVNTNTTINPIAEIGLILGGKLQIVDGNQAAGKVLTSDANGVGTWQAAAGGANLGNCQVQRGLVTGVLRDTAKNVTFASPFPAGIIPTVVISSDASIDGQSTAYSFVSNVTNTGFTVAAQANTSIQYIAVGTNCSGGTGSTGNVTGQVNVIWKQKSNGGNAGELEIRCANPTGNARCVTNGVNSQFDRISCSDGNHISTYLKSDGISVNGEWATTNYDGYCTSQP